MSRRKQSRPQHLEHGEKEMPGTDFTVAEDKLAVTSPNREIEFKGKRDKPVNLDMTQSAMIEGERALEPVPSTNGTGMATPGDKMAALNAAKTNTQRSGSPDRNEGRDTTSTFAVRQSLEHNDASVADGSVTLFSPRKDPDCAKINLEVPETTTESSSRQLDIRVDKNTANIDDEKKKLQDKNLMKPPYQQLPPAIYGAMAIERKHVCKKCGVSFRSRETYEVHAKHYCCGKRQCIDCQICGAKFDSNWRLEMHMDVHVPRNVCLLCSKGMRESDCEQHVLSHMESIQEKDGIIQCPSCDLSFKEKLGFLTHIQMHHIISESMMPFFCSHPDRSIPKHSSNLSSVSGRNANVEQKTKAHGSERFSGINDSPPVNIYDASVRDISPSMKTSTPSSSSAVKETEATTVEAFSCIVCGFGFPNVIALQRHLLTTHTAATDRKKSPARKLSDEETLRTKITRPNLRKVSTVSPPQLSLLSTISTRKNWEPCPSKTTMNPPKTGSIEANCHSSRNLVSAIYSKKQKITIREENDRKSDFVQIQENFLKRAKRDSECKSTKEKHMSSSDRLSSETRRVSCPVVSNNISGTEQFEMQGSSFQNQHDTDRHCVQCDIKFSSLGNFRAHKQFYCASRHIPKIRDGIQKELCDDREHQNGSSSESEGLYSKSRKRNVGNRSSMTPRKRSHLIPLETAGGSSSPLYEGTAAAKPTSVRKSCPSQFVGVDASSRSSPSNNPSPTSIPNLTKKHLCQECNISFSKYDTYIAHKKHYCESRRKDRIEVRYVQSLPRNHSKRRSESNLRDAISQSDNTHFVPERSGWSSRGSSPSTEAEDERHTAKNDAECPVNLQPSTTTSYIPQFPFYGQVDAEILARLPFMQPLILNQYIAMLRERMTQAMHSNGILFPTPPFADLLSTGSDLPINRIRKLSADETHLCGAMDRDGSTSPLVRRTNRPARQSCAAVINVKQENGKSDEEHLRTTSANSAPLHYGASPLDLSTKLSAELTETENFPKSPYPTIDLSKTALPIVKQEPHADFPTRNSCRGETTNLNENNAEVNRASPVVTVTVNNQAPHVKHCKNCDARFTSLSTFIAHKKYYCAGPSSEGLVRNDVKPTQLAH